ncbi:MAG: heat-inducible transcriptional repressor HrcA [Actinomycetales bacterium]|nr:heat-inducible transcriptional repressor HrcA [Actinomycetales bacterium]
MLDDRKLAVLRAIVEDFVQTNEPVGSKMVAERHVLGVSSATIRNDMAALEDEGLITQPHTSAGRIPTDAGYRLFVDRLSSVKPLSGAERRAIETFLAGSVDLDDVMQRSVRLLARLTQQVALVQYPSLSKSSVRHVELVPVSPTRLLFILVTDTGRVEQRVVDLPSALDDDSRSHLRAQLNAAVAGSRLADVPALVADLGAAAPGPHTSTMRTLVSTLLDTVAEQREERVVLGGAANLARAGSDFHGEVQSVLEALEEHVVLLRLLSEVSEPEAVTVRIGAENQAEGLASASLVATSYGSASRSVAALGVLGPTRMDYPGTMAAVRAVAQYVGRIVAEG